MFTCSRIVSAEYYIAAETAAYYDNGTVLGETRAMWWTGGVGDPAGALVDAGTEVRPDDLRKLAQGFVPATGEHLTQARNENQTVGYDCTFSSPKAVGVLYAAGDDEMRRVLLACQHAAVVRAMDFAAAEGLIETRRGKGGRDREPVGNVAAALYHHTTTRENDPELHTHAVLVNACRRLSRPGEPATTGTIDNKTVLMFQGALGAVYRTELADQIRTRLGLEIERKARAFTVVGVDEAVCDAFSKRRTDIVSALKAAGTTSAADRARAQVVALATRKKRGDLDLAVIESAWLAQIEDHGWTKERLVQAARDAADHARQQTLNDNGGAAETVAMRRTATTIAAGAAIESLMEHNAVIERRHLLQEAIERMQGLCDADTAIAAVESAIRSGQIIQIGEDDGRPVYSTKAVIEAERQMLKDAIERQDEREWVPTVEVERAIARKIGISLQQSTAVRFALGQNGVVAIEGSAGSGKSAFVLHPIADCLRACRIETHVVCPSWAATEVARLDTEVAAEMARAMTGFIARLESGDIVLTSRSAVIVDEAAMVGTMHMAALLRHARAAGAKVILSGDTRQLQPVAAGGPMLAIAKTCGTRRVEAIQRQKVAWQRAASEDFARGKAGLALDAYDAAGRVVWTEDKSAAITSLATAWRRDVEDNPGATSIVIAERNADVHLLNAALRAEWAEVGRLTGPEVAFMAIGRGDGAKVAEIGLRAGDRVIFGESVAVGGITVNNSDMANVVAVEPDQNQPSQPRITFRLDKGGTFACRPAELVGWRSAGAEDAGVPRVAPAFAVTTFAAQGKTVDRAFVFEAHGMGAEASYVACTRARHDCRIFVDAGRLAARIEARRTGAEVGIAATASEIKESLATEWTRTGLKRNVSDFVPVERLIAGEAIPVKKESRPRQTGDDIRRRMADRQTKAVPYLAPIRPVQMSISDQRDELDRLIRSVDMVDFLQRRGYRPVNPRGVDRQLSCGLELVDGRGDRVSVKRRHGVPDLWCPSSHAEAGGGTIVQWLQQREASGTIGQTRKLLRQMVGTISVMASMPPSSPSPVPPLGMPNRVEDLAPAERDSVKAVARRWAAMVEGVSDRLAAVRGFTASTIDRFCAHIRRDRNGRDCWAHRDDEGRVVGYEIKGDRGDGDQRAYSRFSHGGRRWLGRFGDWEQKPESIVVVESGAEAMAFDQHHGGPARTIYLSTAGQPSAESIRELQSLARRWPEASWALAYNRDVAGSAFCRGIEAALRRVNPGVMIEDGRPPPTFKDWCDVVVGREKPAAVATAEAVVAAAVWMAPGHEQPTIDDQTWAALTAGDRRALRSHTDRLGITLPAAAQTETVAASQPVASPEPMPLPSKIELPSGRRQVSPEITAHLAQMARNDQRRSADEAVRRATMMDGHHRP